MNSTSSDVSPTAEKQPSAAAVDLAVSASQTQRPVLSVNTDGVVQTSVDKTLAPLFTPNAATEFRSRWDDVQRGFVDDPRQAVRAGDELVGQVIKSLAANFSNQRATIEGEEESSTENLRLALRSYRSFFERLLSI